MFGKRILLRADYNVPLDGNRIGDDYRLQASLPTIEYILGQKPQALVIIAHLGRPKGPNDRSCSLAPVAKRLEKLLGHRVFFVSDTVGPTASSAAEHLPKGGVLLLENLRFNPGEEADSEEFARALVAAAKADIFVQDGFGVVHRKHASTHAITKLLPSVAGLLLAKEVTSIGQAIANPARPLTAIVGGAKIADKIDILDKFVDIADCVAIGGALANDFLHAVGVKIGKSLVDSQDFDLAHRILAKARKAERERNFKFIMPVDGVVSTSADGRAATRVVDFGSDSLADIESYPKRPQTKAYNIGANEMILDIGPISAARITGAVDLSRTVIWSGTLGMTEVKGIAGAHDPFGHGTRLVAEAIIGASNTHANKAFSVAGGGDTVSYIESKNWTGDFSFVSTGGSASLELMAGHKLPGLEALNDK